MKKLFFVYQLIFMVINLVPLVLGAENIILPVDFNKAMVSHPEDKKKYNKFLKNTPHKKLLKLIQAQYQEFVGNAELSSFAEPTIPKIIHQIWIGPHPFPQEAREWQQSWSKIHPDWEYKLWTNEDVKQLDFPNKKYFDEATNWGEKADILRYELIYEFGGLYVDVDFASLKPLDFLHYACDFYTGIHAVPLLFANKLRINNGLIAARPHHPILARAREQIQHSRYGAGVASRTGPDFFTGVINDVLPASLAQGSVDMVFPSNFFYPSGPKGGPGFKIKAGQAYVQPETLAVHYYTAYWIVKPKKRHARQVVLAKSVSKEFGSQEALLGKEPKQLRKRPSGNIERMAMRYQQYRENRRAQKLTQKS